MAESVINNYFPSQVVSDAEKLSYDYGLKIAKLLNLNGSIKIVETPDILPTKMISTN